MGTDLALAIATLAIVAVVGLGGATITWWALFGDRARGRRRCPRCWHDLSGTPGLTCGECGHAAAAEAALFATRRRWPMATATVAFTLGVAGWVHFEAIEGRWTAMVPDAGLELVVEVLPADSVPGWAWSEIGTRAAIGWLSPSRQLGILDALTDDGAPIAAGDRRARIVNGLMRAMPTELVDDDDRPRAVHAEVEARRREFIAERERMARRVPAWIGLQLPREWPAATPVDVPFQAWAPGTDRLWRVRPAGDGPWVAGSSERWLPWGGRVGVLHLPAPDADGRWRATLEVQSRAGDGPWRTEAPIVVDRTLAPLPDAQPGPLDDDELRAAIRAAFDFPVSVWPGATRPVTFTFDPRVVPETRDGLARIVLGVRLELLHRGEVKRAVDFWRSGPVQQYGSEVVTEDLPALAALAESLPMPHPDHAGEPVGLDGWTLRARGLRPIALRGLSRTPEGGACGYWAGLLEWPARSVFGAGPAPEPPQWTMPATP